MSAHQVLMSIARWCLGTMIAVAAFAICDASASATVRHLALGLTAQAQALKPPPPQAQDPCREVIASGGRCYSPHVLEQAYGVSPLLAHGVNGHGVTVVLPEQWDFGSFPRRLLLHDGTFLRQSLNNYDRRFGLAPVHLRFDTTLAPGVLANYADYEEVEDAEMVHAIAPGATIVVELVAGSPLTPRVIDEGVRDGDVMSFSYALSERSIKPRVSAIKTALAKAQASGVSVLASAGDTLDTVSSHMRGVAMPASDPLVTAVGGTTLRVNSHSGAYASETAWNQPLGPNEDQEGSGGGFSELFPRPAFQAALPISPERRGVPDVAFSASDSYASELVFYTEGEACAPHFAIKKVDTPAAAKLHCVQLNAQGGTSEGAPAWAGIAALADQSAHRLLGSLNPDLYRIGESHHRRQAFHDVTSGDNTATVNGRAIVGYRAAPGWDPVTGWGSPDAQTLVPLLAQEDRGLSAASRHS